MKSFNILNTLKSKSKHDSGTEMEGDTFTRSFIVWQKNTRSLTSLLLSEFPKERKEQEFQSKECNGHYFISRCSELWFDCAPPPRSWFALQVRSRKSHTYVPPNESRACPRSPLPAQLLTRHTQTSLLRLWEEEQKSQSGHSINTWNFSHLL